jgi:hypothetical protein
MIYAAQLARLHVEQGEDPDAARGKFDSDLGVSEWRRTRDETATKRPDVDPDAPWWWHGDEEASQGFMAAMGVRLD